MALNQRVLGSSPSASTISFHIISYLRLHANRKFAVSISVLALY